MKKKLEEALARIAALEARVAALEARPYYVPWVPIAAPEPAPVVPWINPPIYELPRNLDGTAAPFPQLPYVVVCDGGRMVYK